jgi:hypothetical protein
MFTNDLETVVTDLRKAQNALFLVVDERVAEDINYKINNALRQQDILIKEYKEKLMLFTEAIICAFRENRKIYIEEFNGAILTYDSLLGAGTEDGSK